MQVEFADATLQRLYEDADYRPKRYGADLIRAYRKKVGLLCQVRDDLELRQHRSLRLEQLVGSRRGSSSIRLNDQWRLILTFRTDVAGRVVVVLEIVDYH